MTCCSGLGMYFIFAFFALILHMYRAGREVYVHRGSYPEDGSDSVPTGTVCTCTYESRKKGGTKGREEKKKIGHASPLIGPTIRLGHFRTCFSCSAAQLML